MSDADSPISDELCSLQATLPTPFYAKVEIAAICDLKPIQVEVFTMYCVKCGVLLLENARYCHSCGTPVADGPSGASTAMDDENYIYEVCTVDVFKTKAGSFLNPFALNEWQWQADAIGPKGSYLAAWSSKFKAWGEKYDGPGLNQQKAHDELIAIMLKEGWEPMDTSFYGQSFRRRTKPKAK